MISIIAPVYNEEEVLHSLYDRIREVMESTGEEWELMLVNDGRRDRSANQPVLPRATSKTHVSCPVRRRPHQGCESQRVSPLNGDWRSPDV